LILAAIAKILTGGLLDKITGLADSYLKGQITKAEFEAKVKIEAGKAQAELEQEWVKASTAQYESFQTTLRTSDILQRAYAMVMISQLFVLLWYQWGASAFKLVTDVVWPSPGATIEWAYLLVGGAMGLGPVTSRILRGHW
jgi:hypothetical protein